MCGFSSIKLWFFRKKKKNDLKTRFSLLVDTIRKCFVHKYLCIILHVDLVRLTLFCSLFYLQTREKPTSRAIDFSSLRVSKYVSHDACLVLLCTVCGVFFNFHIKCCKLFKCLFNMQAISFTIYCLKMLQFLSCKQ